MARMTHILLNIADWHTDTARLTKRVKGCYIDLLGAYYRNGGPLPYDLDELCMVLGYKNTRSVKVDIEALLRGGQIYVMETPTGPVLVNNRSDEEIRKFEAARQGRIAGGKNSKPGTRNAAVNSAENGPETGFEPISSRYGADIEPISSRYRAENDSEIEEKQQVSGSSLITLKFTTTTAQAHARGPVEDQIQPQAPAIPEMIPEMADDPADAPAPRALVAKIPTSAPRPTRDKPCAVNPYIGPNAFNRTKPVPDEGTPEWDAYQRKQHRLNVTGEVKRIMVEAGVWNEAEDLDSAFIAGWLHSGADPELHIYPTVRTKSARMAEKGDRVRGIGIFTADIGKLVQREKAIAANPAVFAEAERQQSRYSKTETPRLAITAQVQETIKLALQNKWEDLHDQMVNLLKAANAGDEQSLRLLNDLCANHEGDVRERYSDWCARRNSSAA